MESYEEDQPEVFQLVRMILDRFYGNRQWQAMISAS
jgi:hypothetical protein